MFFSIGRNCLPEPKLGEYVVHIIDNPQKKNKKARTCSVTRVRNEVPFERERERERERELFSFLTH